MTPVQRVVKAKFLIDAHYSEPLNLDEIAKEACLSKYHFLRLFKKTYQITPHQYLLKKRIEIAREKLANEEFSIAEICNMIGFESIGSFSYKFKKMVGESPSDYRLRIQQDKEISQEKPRRVIPYCFIQRMAFEDSNFEEEKEDKPA